MKFLVVKGNVVGGHYVADMSLEIAYGQEVQVPYDRASWSRDLMRAIERGMVIRVAILQRDLHQKPPPLPARKARKAISKGKGGESRTFNIERLRKQGDNAKGVEQEEVEALKALNKELVGKLDQMLKSQQEMMEKLQSLEEKKEEEKLKISYTSQGPTNQGPGKQGQRQRDFVIEEDTPVIFIPSEIRSKELRVSENTEIAVEETQSEISTLNDAAAALAELKKLRKTQ